MWKEKLKNTAQTREFQIAAASTFSFAVGVFVGYKIAKKRLKKVYEERANQEIAEARRFYVERDKPDLEEMSKPYEDEIPDEDIEAVREAVTILREQSYVSYNTISKEPSETEQTEVKESIKKNIFETNDPMVDDGGYDLDDELEKKNAGLPYIVEHDFFMENEGEYSQVTFVYYEDDDTVAEEDNPLSAADEKRILGENNLKFGRGSKSANTVFICNDKLKIMIEVIRNQGSFKEIVLGYPSGSSLEHSDGPKIRKFRKDLE